MTPVLIGALLLVLVLAVILALRGRGGAQTIEERMAELAAMGQSASLEELELSQPFSQRVIIPLLEGLSHLAQRFTPKAAIEASRHKLELAGISQRMRPSQFLGIRMALGLFLGVGALLLAITGANLTFFQRLLVPLVGFVLGYMLPSVWLGMKISQRQQEILRALPDALDLLTICLEAGLGFDSSMDRVADKWNNELSRAFKRAVQEMQLGKLRREALRNMANSMDVPDVTSFVAAMIQADHLGVSMAKVMRIQSDTMRVKRRQRAEERARQAPVRMMFPLVFLIFPTILVVLLGPAFIQIKDSGVFGGG